MKKVFAETFPRGTLKAAVTSITLVNNTGKVQDVTVPDDTIWELISIKITNPDNVARDFNAIVYKEAAKTNEIQQIMSLGAIASLAKYTVPNDSPALNTAICSAVRGMLLGPNWTINCIWSAGGASAGGTDADGLVIAYRELLLT